MFAVHALIFVATISQIRSEEKPAVLVLSFDGFKPEYFNKDSTPFLYGLRSIAAGPEYMKSVFPTKTFVTHFSLATGVYPEVHGVYGNTMFDKNGKIIFNKAEQFQTNKKITPIWIENEKNDGNSGVMMWPGSQFEYNGTKADFIEIYNEELKWENRAKIIIDWMSKENNRANLVMAYFEDFPIHNSDDLDAQKKAHCKKVDDIIKTIYEGLKAKKIHSDLDMIILSDHGTQQVKYDNALNIEDYVEDDDDVSKIVSGPNVIIKVDDDELSKTVYENLSSSAGYPEKYKVYKTENLPEKFHLKNCPNLEGKFFLVAEPGYTFYEKTDLNNLLKSFGECKDKFITQENGYDADNSAMNSFFLGIGPSFKDNVYLNKSFSILDVHPLLRKLLGTNGSNNDVQPNTSLNETVKEILMDNVVNS